jgi:hypothetical protein
MKRTTFLNCYAGAIAILIITLDITAFILTVDKEYVGLDTSSLWILTILLNIMGAIAIWILITETRQEHQ